MTAAKILSAPKRALWAAAFLLALALVWLSGCAALGPSKSQAEIYTEQLVGTWYNDRNWEVVTFYSDGTCKIDGEYGTGRWSVVNDDQLKLLDFYGQIVNFFGEDGTMQIVSIEDGVWTLANKDGMEGILYNSPQE